MSDDSSMTESQIPLIIGFVEDLLFSSKIEVIAEQMGYRVIWRDRADQIFQDEHDVSPLQLADHVFGSEWILLDKITRWHPALMVFDLSNNKIPWRDWLPLIKSSPATRRIPVICFGSHVDAQAFRDAKSAGADAVLARSQFITKLPELLQKYSRLPNSTQMAEVCGQVLSKQAIKGLEQFNRGEYFEAHESLEEAWNDDDTPGRELYRAILQVAVAYLQIERKNYLGAVKMFLRLRQWIDPLPDTCRGVNVAQLRRDTDTVYEALIQLGADRIYEFDEALFHNVSYALDMSE